MTWVAAVCLEIDSSAATWRLVNPRATSLATSSSRRLRTTSACPAEGSPGAGVVSGSVSSSSSVRRRQLHLAPSPDPCSTPSPMLPLPCPSAQRKCERQPRRGSRCLWECPLFRVRPALLPTAAPPAPLLLLLQPRRQTPPRHSGLAGSFRCPMRGRGFLCRGPQPCRGRLGAGPSTPSCKGQ